MPVVQEGAGIKKIIALIMRGGWPGTLSMSLESALLIPSAY